MQKSLYCLITACLFAACSFDAGGAADPGDDDPAAELSCETDRDCQEAGFDCNVYTCNDDNRCEVMDTLCEEGQVCRVGGCEEAPAVECQEHYECDPDPGCEAAYCTEDGTCESYSCGPSLECQTDADCGPDHECNAGSCEALPECGVDADCPEHDWSCYDRDCDGGTCGYADTCASGYHCTASGCEVDSPTDGRLSLHCENIDGTRITFNGDIRDAIVTAGVGDLPGTPGKVSLAGNVGLGSGVYWPSTSSGYDTSHPACDVAVDADGKWYCTSYLGIGDSVQQFNIIVSNSANTDLRYGDLSKIDVSGYCSTNGEGLICSCETLPCTCP